MSRQAIALAVVGVGKIARDQHLPTLSRHPDFSLVATVDPNSTAVGVPSYPSIDEAVAARPEIQAVVICTPPQARYAVACAALSADRHVFLEKPPGTSAAEVTRLQQLAAKRGLTLFAGWHSRAAAGVEPAREWLAGRNIRSVNITWKEDVRHWHPGQNWIFEAGGMGVFDPGINALSIVTRVLPDALSLRSAQLSIPANRHAPIAAELLLETERGAPVTVSFDFLKQGQQSWDIEVTTDSGTLVLSEGGAALAVDGTSRQLVATPEYRCLYDQFAALIRARSSDVDLAPLVLVADAFRLGERHETAAFEWQI